MDVLVTGGAGFIGAHLCRALRASPDVGRVIVLDDLSTGVASNLAGLDDVDVVVGSVLDQRLVDTLVSQCGAVAHLAAIPAVARSLDDPRATHDVNVNGTLEVLDAARARRLRDRGVVLVRLRRGTRRCRPPRTTATRPASPYAASKLAAESYALSYGRSFGLPRPRPALLQRLRPVAASRSRLCGGDPGLRGRGGGGPTAPRARRRLADP